MNFKTMQSVLSAIILCAASMHAADRYVWTNSTSPDGQFQSWETAAHTIQEAVSAAADGETVWVTNGTYLLTNTITVAKSIVLKGINGREFSIIDGNYPTYSNRGLTVNAVTAVVDGFTISNCFSTAGGSGTSAGGVYLRHQSKLQNCLITHNHHPTEGGGGVAIYEDGVVSNCEVAYNSAYQLGGGIYIYRTGTVAECFIHDNLQTQLNTSYRGGGGVSVSKVGAQIIHCVISNNISHSSGGGLYLEADCLVSNCTIVYNSNNVPGNAFYGGGVAMYRYPTNALLIDSLVAHNSAPRGGGVCGYYGGLIRNCTIENNLAGGGGGGVSLMYGGEITGCRIFNNSTTNVGGNAYGPGLNLSSGGEIRNCLIAGNWSLAPSGHGGGIYANDIAVDGGWIDACTIVSNSVAAGALSGGVCLYGSCSVTNSIIHGNAKGDYYTGVPANTNMVWYSCLTNAMAPDQGNITNPATFADFAGCDYRLTGGSAGINAGTNLPWMLEPGAVDLDGRPRRDRFSRQADMGCYEYVPGGVMFSVH